MKIREIADFLNDFAPLALQEPYDNSGLTLGNPDDTVTGMLICLDIVPEIIEEAISLKCNLILSHHPLIFQALKKVTASTPVEKMVMTAIRNNISVISAHTNLDNITDGVNFALAGKLGLLRHRILRPQKGLLRKLVTFCPSSAVDGVREAVFNAGAGHIGNYDSCSFNTKGQGTFKANELANPFVGEKNKLHFEPETRIETIFPCYRESEVITALLAAHPYEEVAYDIYSLGNEFPRVGSGRIGELEKRLSPDKFLSLVKNKLNVKHIRYASGAQAYIKKVAVCGGSGSFLLQEAMNQGADAFITGDIKYHDFHNASGQIYLIDAGHYETEYPATEHLKNVLSEKFSNFAIFITKHYTNPVHCI